MSVTYHYYRYYAPNSIEIETLFSALRQARYDVEYNEAYPEKIVCEDGTELDHDEILQRSGFYGDTDINVEGSISPIITDPTRLLD